MTWILPADDAIFAAREEYREWYLRNRDPIFEDRMLWRAQTFRHVMHLLPGQTILELGCGRGEFTRQLALVSRGENPITAVTFARDTDRPVRLPLSVEFLHAESLPGPLADKRFDFVVVLDLLDQRNCASLLQCVYRFLKPGGHVLFYQSNPWNIVLRLRRLASKVAGEQDSRSLLSRTRLYELTSAIGFIRVFAVYNDFVYSPLTRQLIWLLRNLSTVLENMPGVQTLAGSILLHAQKPPEIETQSTRSLCTHDQLRRAVSIVIPCHNEEMNIGPLIRQLRRLFDGYIHEIIPVEDNSTDGTAEVIKALAREDSRIRPVFRSPPGGVGRAIADGYQMATGSWVLSMDCDFQHVLPEVRDLFDAGADGYDVVVGSRFRGTACC